MEDAYAEAEKKIDRLIDALEFIAEGTWTPGTKPATIISDMRLTARNALAHLP